MIIKTRLVDVEWRFGTNNSEVLCVRATAGRSLNLPVLPTVIVGIASSLSVSPWVQISYKAWADGYVSTSLENLAERSGHCPNNADNTITHHESIRRVPRCRCHFRHGALGDAEYWWYNDMMSSRWQIDRASRSVLYLANGSVLTLRILTFQKGVSYHCGP